ncbi:MAG: divalent-cation tolerance protein CutA [Candidatus Micrarchaeota archaeon]|nr:divalent-cation tolerance protein CutA [Candidatus Micrarchaeota archaeon]
MYIVMTTTKDPKRICEDLVRNRYAACVSYKVINSVYVWEGKMCDEQEYLLIIKTARPRRTISRLKEIHDYRLPEILYMKVNASREYRDWVMRNS